MPGTEPGTEPGPLRQVRDLLTALEVDRDVALSAAEYGDPGLSAAASAALAYEGRLLDAGRLDAWLTAWEPDGVFWVPLPLAYASHDQSLLLDDRRRLTERVAWLRDPNAWGVQPAPRTVRAVSNLEAWPSPGTQLRSSGDAAEMLVSSVVRIQVSTPERTWSTSGRQVHRMRRRTGAGGQQQWGLVRKVLMLPELASGLPNLGWLL